MSSPHLLPDGRSYDDMRVTDLKKELESKGLGRSGSKRDLFERLHASMTEETDSSDKDNTKDNSMHAVDPVDDDALELNAPDSDMDGAETAAPVTELTEELAEKSAQESENTVPSEVRNDVGASATVSTNQQSSLSSRRRQWGSGLTVDRSSSKSTGISSASLEKLIPTLTTVAPVDITTSHISVAVPEAAVLETDPHETASVIEDYVPTVGAATGELECDSISGAIEVDDVSHDQSLLHDTKLPVDDQNSLTTNVVQVESNKSENTSSNGIRQDAARSPTGKPALTDSMSVESPKKAASKRRGPKETKAVGYLIEQPERIEAAEPAMHHPTDIIYIRFLVRPFTADQLKQMISSRFGSVLELWLDRIKSNAVVRLDSVKNAARCREALDGCRWPSINPRILRCDFGSDELLQWMQEYGNSGDQHPPQHLVYGQLHQQTEQAQKTIKESKSAEEHIGGTKNKRATEPNPGSSSRDKSDFRGRLDRRDKRGDDTRATTTTTTTTNTADNNSTLPPAQPPNTPSTDAKPLPPKNASDEPAKLLDDLFRKTTTLPFLYWLPLDAEQAHKQAVARAQWFNCEKRSTAGCRPRPSARDTRSPFTGPALSLQPKPTEHCEIIESSPAKVPRLMASGERSVKKSPSTPATTTPVAPKSTDKPSRLVEGSGDKSKPVVPRERKEAVTQRAERDSSQRSKVTRTKSPARSPKREHSPFTPKRKEDTGNIHPTDRRRSDALKSTKERRVPDPVGSPSSNKKPRTTASRSISHSRSSTSPKSHRRRSRNGSRNERKKPTERTHKSSSRPDPPSEKRPVVSPPNNRFSSRSRP